VLSGLCHGKAEPAKPEHLHYLLKIPPVLLLEDVVMGTAAWELQLRLACGIAANIIRFPTATCEEFFAAGIDMAVELLEQVVHSGISLRPCEVEVVRGFIGREELCHVFASIPPAEVLNKGHQELKVPKYSFWVICGGMSSELDGPKLVHRNQVQLEVSLMWILLLARCFWAPWQLHDIVAEVPRIMIVALLQGIMHARKERPQATARIIAALGIARCCCAIPEEKPIGIAIPWSAG